MNYNIINQDRINELKFKINYLSRLLGRKTIKQAFNDIDSIYVINLDRAEKRWEDMENELDRIKIGDGKTLLNITKRFRAVDAKMDELFIEGNVIPEYHLSDQIQVEPIPNFELKKDYKIDMSKQEIAVALSHIGVWKKIIEENCEYALILEDDIFFDKSFSKEMDKIWTNAKETDFDMLFISFGYVKGVDQKQVNKRSLVHEPVEGIWQASGYILSKKGAEKLLSFLPVYGPVDLWFNLKFKDLNALMIKQPLIKQRNDCTSSNAYSIMPVLQSLGLFNDVQSYNEEENLPFILAYGKSDLTSLSEALSIIGYSCLSNLKEQPADNNVFNAYVNVFEFDINFIRSLNKKDIRIICTDIDTYNKAKQHNLNCLLLEKDTPNKWEKLVKYLKIETKKQEYPILEDKEQKEYELITEDYDYTKQKWDNLPWINTSEDIKGIRIKCDRPIYTPYLEQGMSNGWDNVYYRTDTFPGNLSLFKEGNINILSDNILELTLKEEENDLKDYSSAAIGLTKPTKYGKYTATLKPSNASGTITGMFLYRSNPHQEIDIEFLGKDNYGFLANVFYNPGCENTISEYGLRGTPVWIKLDFDVTEKFHKYELEWTENYIIWRVDDKEVYRRDVWNPTPIPNLEMEFNINIWNSNSIELVGEMNKENLPTNSKIKKLKIEEIN